MRSTPSAFSCTRQFDRLLDVPAAIRPVRGRDAHKQAGSGPASALRTASAVSRKKRVRFSKEPPYSSSALVAERRQEFVHQVAVRRVNLDDAEPGARSAPPRARRPSRIVDSRPRSFRAAWVALAEAASALGPTGRQPPSATLTAPLPDQGRTVLALRPACASWMPAIDAMRVDEPRDPLKRLEVRIAPRRPDPPA